MQISNSKLIVTMPTLAIIVPCYNEEQVLQETAMKLKTVIQKAILLEKVSNSSHICFVDDGSTDNTWNIICEICNEESTPFKGLRLSRNFGHQNALYAGLENFGVTVDCCISIDADLQQDEEKIPEFINSFIKGADIVYGIRNNRNSDGFIKKNTASLFYLLMRFFGTEIIENHADYRLLSRKAVTALVKYNEHNLFLRGLVTQLGFKSDFVHFEVKQRYAGQTKYTMKKMVSFALNGITSFSATPLYMVSFTGIMVCLASILMMLYVLYIRLFFSTAIPGWASTVLPSYFIGGLNIFCTGILGIYLGKIYMETKRRPVYIVSEKV